MAHGKNFSPMTADLGLWKTNARQVQGTLSLCVPGGYSTPQLDDVHIAEGRAGYPNCQMLTCQRTVRGSFIYKAPHAFQSMDRPAFFYEESRM